MLLDFTLNNKGGHFDFYANWCKSIDENVIYSKRAAISNFFSVIFAKKLIITSGNIFDRHFLFYYFFLIIRYFIGKNKNYIIVHTSQRLSLYSFIAPKNIAKHFAFSQGLNSALKQKGFCSEKIIFPNVKEFDVKEKIIDLPFKDYIIIWGRSARTISLSKEDFLVESKKNYIILNSGKINSSNDNIFYYNTDDITIQKFLIKQSLASLIIPSDYSIKYFEKTNAGSGILITNIYLNVYSFIIGNIPSHKNDFSDYCVFIDKDIEPKNFNKIISRKITSKKFNFNYNSFEEYL